MANKSRLDDVVLVPSTPETRRNLGDALTSSLQTHKDVPLLMEEFFKPSSDAQSSQAAKDIVEIISSPAPKPPGLG